MSAFMVVTIRLRDLAWAADYAATVPAIVRRHGGEYLALSKATTVKLVEGSGPVPDAIVLFRFPSVTAANGFIEAPDYQPYRQARIAGTDGNIVIFENDDDAPQFALQ